AGCFTECIKRTGDIYELKRKAGQARYFMRQSIPSSRGGRRSQSDEKFSIRRVPAAFASLPRVLHLVWSTSQLLTMMMGLLSLLQGFTPAISVSISALLIDRVVQAISKHSISYIW